VFVGGGGETTEGDAGTGGGGGVVGDGRFVIVCWVGRGSCVWWKRALAKLESYDNAKKVCLE
jgi:hypothetical protein